MSTKGLLGYCTSWYCHYITIFLYLKICLPWHWAERQPCSGRHFLFKKNCAWNIKPWARKHEPGARSFLSAQINKNCEQRHVSQEALQAVQCLANIADAYCVKGNDLQCTVVSELEPCSVCLQLQTRHFAGVQAKQQVHKDDLATAHYGIVTRQLLSYISIFVHHGIWLKGRPCSVRHKGGIISLNRQEHSYLQ